VLPSHIIIIILNQLNIKKKLKNNFGENNKKNKNKKKFMWRNIAVINNVLKKKITKLNSQSTQC
jgi:hypothetical protein